MIISRTQKVWPNAFSSETVNTEKGSINFFAGVGELPRVTIVRGSKARMFEHRDMTVVRGYFNHAVRVMAK